MEISNPDPTGQELRKKRDGQATLTSLWPSLRVLSISRHNLTLLLDVEFLYQFVRNREVRFRVPGSIRYRRIFSTWLRVSMARASFLKMAAGPFRIQHFQCYDLLTLSQQYRSVFLSMILESILESRALFYLYFHRKQKQNSTKEQRNIPNYPVPQSGINGAGSQSLNMLTHVIIITNINSKAHRANKRNTTRNLLDNYPQFWLKPHY